MCSALIGQYVAESLFILCALENSNSNLKYPEKMYLNYEAL